MHYYAGIEVTNAMTKYTNTHDTNNVVVTNKHGKAVVLKPGEECELFDKEASMKKTLEANQKKAEEAARLKAEKEKAKEAQ